MQAQKEFKKHSDTSLSINIHNHSYELKWNILFAPLVYGRGIKPKLLVLEWEKLRLWKCNKKL